MRVKQLDMNETSITRTTIDKAKSAEDLTDLKRVDSMGESEIENGALLDLDNQPLTPNNLKKVRRIKRK